MMKKSPDERIAQMTFASVYPHYVAKVLKKGRTEEELLHVISWLSGYSESEIIKLSKSTATFEQFFSKAELNPNAALIKGVICGIKVEDIINPLTQQVRYLDKIVDELAKGKSMDKILRGNQKESI